MPKTPEEMNDWYYGFTCPHCNCLWFFSEHQIGCPIKDQIDQRISEAKRLIDSSNS